MEDMSLTGSSSVSSDKLDSVNDTNGLNSVSKVDNNRISGLIASSDDENEGFVSGVEDFETNLDENSGDVVNVDEEKFAEASEVPAPKVVVDDEKDNSGLVENSKLNEGVKEEGVGGSEGDKVSGSKEVVVDETAPKSLSGDDVKSGSPMEGGEEVVEANGVTGGDSVVEDLKVDTPAPGVAVVSSTEDVTTDEDEGVVLVGGPDDPNAIDEETDVETDGINDVKTTSEGDSVVEAVDVDLPLPGVAEAAVDTKTEEVGVETVGINDANATSEGVETVGVNDVNATSEGDSVVEAVDVDLPLPGAPGVAVVTKTEEVGGDLAVAHESGSPEKMDRLLEEVVDKEVVGVTEGKFSPLVAEDSVDYDAEKNEKNMEVEVEKGVDYEGKEILDKAMPDDVVQAKEVLSEDIPNDADEKAKHVDMGAISTGVEDSGLENGMADKFVLEESAEKDDADEEGYMDSSPSEEETDGVIFGSSEAAKQFMVELERGSGEGGGSNTGGESSQDHPQMIDGQIVTDSDEEDDEEDGKELFDSAALAALLKAAAEGGSEGGNITFSSQDGSRLFTVERPAGLGPSLQTMRAAPRPARPNIFNPSSLMSGGESDSNLSEEEKKKLEKLQLIRVKFLRLVQRLGLSQDESVAAQVLYRLALIAGRQTGQFFSLDAAKRKAVELEAEGIDDLDFSVNILVIGKAGVGKSATINSIFGEEKTGISAFQPATAAVKEIRGMVGGVMIRVFDTPGLRSSVMDQGFNRSVLSSAKRFTKKNPPDIVLYVDRLDAQTRDHNDIPLLKTITSSLGPSIWRSAIVTLTHGASAPPEGSNGIPLSYEMFVTQRSHVVQQAIGQAVGDLRMMSPSLMNPVSLVENHQSCRKNREGQKVLPNGQTWRPQLLMLCYSMKILAEANSFSKPQDPYDTRKLFGFRGRSPPLPYMLSSMLQSRAHPKLSSEQGGDGGDSDIDLADLSDSDQEEDEDEYDQLPPFKPLKRSQLSKLNREQKKAYFDEYDYRVKLLQKKQWKEELKRMREMKKKGKDAVNDQSYPEEEGEGDAPAPVAVPLPDMALPPSFDSDNPAYRFRFLEPTSQFLARPVLDTHGWDHDCGYDGVNLEQSLAIANRFPAAVSVQVTKDKKDFSINLDSSVSTKHGEKGSSMAGFDVQPIGKQLAYIVRGETKFKNLKKNKTAAGMSVTFLGENVVTGFKVEDQIVIGKQFSVIGSAGTVRFQKDSAYGANIEVQRRELDYPIGQVQSTIGLSIIKWRGDLALGFNSLAQFSAGRNSKVAVRAGINNKMSGQITVKTSSSEHLSLALAAVIPSVISAYKKLWPAAGEKYSPY